MTKQLDILVGDCIQRLQQIPKESVNCVVTSPPYFLQRDYGDANQIGLELNSNEYVAKLVEVFRGVRDVLRRDGTLWLNLGDSYVGSGKGRSANGVAWVLENDAKCKQATHRGALEGNIITPKKIEDGYKPKDLFGIPWKVAFALQKDGWYLRKEIIWHKPNPMTESVRDRPTTAHEHIFMFTKESKYYYDKDGFYEPTPQSTLLVDLKKILNNKQDLEATEVVSLCSKLLKDFSSGDISVPTSGVNLRSVWSIVPKAFKGAHFATFPEEIPFRCILLGCPKNGLVLDPFGGSGTTGVVANNLNRDAILIELNPEYAKIAEKRANPIRSEVRLFIEGSIYEPSDRSTDISDNDIQLDCEQGKENDDEDTIHQDEEIIVQLS